MTDPRRDGPYQAYERDGFLVVNTYYLAEKLCVLTTELLKTISDFLPDKHIEFCPGTLSAFYLHVDPGGEWAELDVNAFDEIIIARHSPPISDDLWWHVHDNFHRSQRNILKTTGQAYPLPKKVRRPRDWRLY